MKNIIPFLFILITGIAAAQPGSLDMSFNGKGMVVIAMGDTDNCGHSLAIQSDNKILVTGSPHDALGNCFIMMRLNEDGSMDKSFGIRGIVTTVLEPGAHEEAFTTIIQPDGKILAGGYSNGKFGLVRYTVNGQLDSTFATGGIALTSVGINGMGSGIALQNDGRIIMTGSGNNQFTTVRYLPDGSLDTTFGNSGITGTSVGIYSNATAVSVQNDGKIVVAGSSGNDFGLVRYLADGSIDTTFGLHGIVITPMNISSAPILSMVIQNDGKILTAGGLYYCKTGLARYNTDGTPDKTFGHNGTTACGINSPASSSALVLQPDGKIITSGIWFHDTLTLYFAIARLNTDGSPDSTFGINGCVHTPIQGSHDVANAVIVKKDGKILVEGCSHYPGSSNCDFAVARYNGGVAGISENDHPSPYSIYPNPANDKIFIDIPSSLRSEAKSFSLYTLKGELLFSYLLKSGKNEFSVRSLPEGVYIIRIKSGTKSSEQKLVIKR